MQENLPKAIAIAILTSFIASLVSALTKFLSTHLSMHVIICLQYAVGFCIAAPVLFRRGKGLAAFATQRPGLHLLRGLVGLLSYYSFYFSLLHIPLVESQLLRNAAPLFVPLVVFLMARVGIPKARYLPLSIGFLGVLVILRPSGGEISLWHLVGLSSGLALATSMVSTRLLVRTESSASIVFYYFAIALLVSLPLAVVNAAAAPLYIWILGLLAGAGLYLAMHLYTLSFRYAKPSAIAPINYLGVVFAGLWGWLFWHQTPDLFSSIGILLVILGAIITLYLPDTDKQ